MLSNRTEAQATYFQLQNFAGGSIPCGEEDRLSIKVTLNVFITGVHPTGKVLEVLKACLSINAIPMKCL